LVLSAVHASHLSLPRLDGLFRQHIRYYVGVNRYETALFVALLPFYFGAFGLYQFMVFAVNRQLPTSEKIPHSLFWRGWNRVRHDYKRLYPRSSVYQLAVACAATTAVIAVAWVVLRWWEYTHGQLP
jgi:hypothetical protein